MWCSSRQERQGPPSLVILAAGLGTRYGGLKPLAPAGPRGEALIDYAVYDARRAGFGETVLVVRRGTGEAFRRHLDGTLGGAVPVRLAYQEPGTLPAREKPWGAAHALLSARDCVRGPFAVANADDFYGARAYRLLHDRLGALAAAPPPPRYLVAAYRLGATLSRHGGVSRAVLETERGTVTHIEEVSAIEAMNRTIAGTTAAGQVRRLMPDTPVCTNLWGFTPAVFAALERQLERFAESAGRHPTAELPLSTALAEQIRTGDARVEAFDVADPWLGITYREDLPGVRGALARMAREGTYPEDLAAALTAS